MGSKLERLGSSKTHPLSLQDRLQEIKHDGFRILARRDPTGVRLHARNGHDFGIGRDVGEKFVKP
jgi:ATP-dependent DNA ligase